MVRMAFWYSAFFIGLGLFVYGIVRLFRKKENREGRFAWAALFEFLSCWILFLPDEFYNEVPKSKPVLHVIESIVTALVKTFNIYLGDAFKRVECKGHPVLSSIYGTLVMLTNVVILLLVAGFLASFLDGALQRIRLFFRRNRRIVVFSVCNEKTLAIAESIPSKAKKPVFANCGKNTDGAWKERIAAIGGVRFDASVSEVLRKVVGHSRRVEVFLFGNREEDNLSELERVCSCVEGRRRTKTRVYVELSETPWSLYDEYLKSHNSADGEKLVINFVRTEENFAYNNLLKHSIFEHAKPENDGAVREIRFLLVGMNERNLEMFKAVLHLSQMPGYRITVMVLDPGANREALKGKMPEIYDECNIPGEAVYQIRYLENVRTETEQFESITGKDFPNFTFAFINVGDDMQNAGLAMRLNALCFRMKRDGGYRIQVNIEENGVCDHWNPDLMRNVDIVGTRRTTYDYTFVTMSNIEKGTVAIHNVRYPKEDPKSPTWISYCNNEYNRHSVYARTLSFKYKVQLIDEFYGSDYGIVQSDRIWKIYEHMRWTVYTRTLGYVRADKELLDEAGKLDRKSRMIGRVHHDLIPFDELSADEQDKDALILTPKIVEILKSI